ncbi:hypothetical protein HYFRA_00003986 [Hymenoscyphus fraxineus]|uniref:Uncharacterized protein n=1 Tax=Hymenoscyphus fraxineus TaxID=746836 RepID=A0A9N9KME1_9HELO|nr:hypothetical protein HYFRA_00003986 [Hymenoscyphus fraxineus]
MCSCRCRLFNKSPISYGSTSRSENLYPSQVWSNWHGLCPKQSKQAPNRFQRRGSAEASSSRQPESAATILEPILAAHIFHFPENILDKATPQTSVQEWEPQIDTTPAEAMTFRRVPQAIPGLNQENLDFATGPRLVVI